MDNQETYIGAIDTQTPEQKAKNYEQSEFVTAVAPVVWAEKPQASWRSFEIRDQDGSGTCVAQTYSTELLILAKERYGEAVTFSSAFPYQQRKYSESAGCTSEDIYDIFPRIGNVFEKEMPSQRMSEQQIKDAKAPVYAKDIALTFKAARISLPIDFETVASTIQTTNKGVMVWFKFSPGEWSSIPTVSPSPITSGHSVTAVDFTIYQGKKYLVIQDSWGLGYAMNGLRLISEEYFAARCFLASYIMTFAKQEAALPTRPSFNGSIISAQNCFKWEGLFPLNIECVENWGNITRSACALFQKRYKITPAEGNFGPITQAKLKELYP